jgi:hypothetical protein
VSAYFETGFGNPGIVVLTDEELMALSTPPPIVEYLQSPSPELSSRNQKRRKK